MSKLSPLGMARFRERAKERHKVDISTSGALPFRPRIYKLRRPLSSPTRGMTLDEALRCSRILGLCVIDVDRQ